MHFNRKKINGVLKWMLLMKAMIYLECCGESWPLVIYFKIDTIVTEQTIHGYGFYGISFRLVYLNKILLKPCFYRVFRDGPSGVPLQNQSALLSWTDHWGRVRYSFNSIFQSSHHNLFHCRMLFYLNGIKSYTRFKWTHTLKKIYFCLTNISICIQFSTVFNFYFLFFT